ncbi:MAG: hypothetical protein JNL17_02915 [Cyclobacteriaceae bacterium]|nr:hypothetical protein [Cyclobacteriaceae bacterium]
MGNRSLLPSEKVKREGKKPSEKSAGWSLLGFASFGILACAVAYSIINYSNLSSGEGWGMVQMAGFVALGLAGLFLDFFIQSLTKSRQVANWLGLVLSFLFAWWLISVVFR